MSSTEPCLRTGPIAKALGGCRRASQGAPKASLPLVRREVMVSRQAALMARKLTSNSYVKDVLKEYSGGTQVGGDALERVNELFKEFLVKVAKASKDSLEQDDRSKVSAEDVDFGFNAIVSQSDVVAEPVRFLEALHKMELSQLGEVLRLIVEWNSQDWDKKKK